MYNFPSILPKAALCGVISLFSFALSAPTDGWIDTETSHPATIQKEEDFNSFSMGDILLNTALGQMESTGSVRAEVTNLWEDRYGKNVKLDSASAASPSRMTLTFTDPLDGAQTLQFSGERSTNNSALTFHVYYIDENGAEQRLLTNVALEVSSTGRTPFPTRVACPLPEGCKGVIFENAGASAAYLDNLSMRAYEQQVNILVKSWPVMKGLDLNGILRFKLCGTPNSYEDMTVTVDLKGTTFPEGVESVSVCTPGNIEDSLEALLVGKANTGETRKATVLGTTTVLTGGIATVNVNPALLTAGQEYTFWISVNMKESAAINGKINAKLQDVTLGGTSLKLPDVPAAVQRIGYAVAKPGDTIMEGPQEGKTSNWFRIPGIVRAKNGDLVAVYDIRYNNSNDLPEVMDVGVARSSDGGRTWTQTAVAMNWNPNNNPTHDYHRSWGVGDPCILVDEYTGTLWMTAIAGAGLNGSAATTDVESHSTCQFVLASSDDNGRTWSACKSINTQVRSTTTAWKAMFQGPGHGITVQGGPNDGTLVFPAQIWDGPNKQSCIIYSKDHGQTWVSPDRDKTVAPGQYGIGNSTSECVAAQLSDGSLMLNAKDEGGSKYRAVYTTTDLGNTWTRHPTDRGAGKTLPEPRCQGSIFSVLDSGRMANVLFFSNPATTESRKEMTLKTSLDDGKTWPVSRQIQYDSRRSAGYSDVCLVDDDHVGILYEGFSVSSHILFLSIPVSEVLNVFSVNTADIAVPAEGAAAAQLAVTGDAAWTAASSADWLTLGQDSGTGDGHVTYTVAPFDGVGTREAAITISAPGLKSVSVRVIQTGRAATLTVTPEEIVLDKAASTATLSISCNAAWTASKSADWLTIDSVKGTDGNGTASISVTASPDEFTRSATLAVSSFNVVKTVFVEQRGRKLTWREWQKDKITSKDPANPAAGPEDSAAGDGIANLLKYATGQDPLKPCGNPVSISVKDNRLFLTWPVNEEAVGITFEVEASPDLESWEEPMPVDMPGEFHDQQTIEESGPDRRFLRLKVTKEDAAK